MQVLAPSNVTEGDELKIALMTYPRTSTSRTVNVSVTGPPLANGASYPTQVTLSKRGLGWITLREALRRGVESAFQFEEQELTTHLVGEGDGRRILIVESAEGGAGVWERIQETPLFREGMTASLGMWFPVVGVGGGDGEIPAASGTL